MKDAFSPSELPLADVTGGTPCVELRSLPVPSGARVLVKWEAESPTGTLQDRLATLLVDEAERTGALRPGGKAAVATAGDLGVSLALVCAQRGHPLEVFLPESASLERRALLKTLSVTLTLTPGDTWLEGAFEAARAAVRSRPDGVLLGDDPAWAASVLGRTVGRELVEAFRGSDAGLHAFVCGEGTGATLSGLGTALRAGLPSVTLVPVGIAEAGAHGIQGLQWRAHPYRAPGLQLAARHDVSMQACALTRLKLAREEGMLVTLSSAANIAAALDLAAKLGPHQAVATVVWATGEREFSLLPEGAA